MIRRSPHRAVAPDRRAATPVTLASILAAAVLTGCADPLPVEPVAPPRLDLTAQATFSVTTTSDAGPGSLRQAIADANAAPGADVITFGLPAPSAIALTSGPLHVTDPLTIVGPGAAALSVSGGALSRVLLIEDAGAVSVADVTLRDGFVAGAAGGCVMSLRSALTLERVVVTACAAQGAGGGIAVSGFSDAGLELRLLASTVSGNDAFDGGGGVYVDAHIEAEVRGSTISGNRAGREGGGLGTTGHVLVENSTISGNAAWNHGGGLYAADRGAPGMRVRFSTVANNTSDSNGDGTGDGGGIYTSNATMIVEGSILHGNVDANGATPFASDCGGVTDKTASIARSVVGTLAGCGAFSTTDVIVGDPMLGALADNGGPTATHALTAGSPAIDLATASCPATDQRGVDRPIGAGCDAGSYEFEGLAVSVDIRPGSAENPISTSAMGVVPVAILTTPLFDATQVAPATVRLAGAAPLQRPSGGIRTSLEDVDGDGDTDLVLFFAAAQLGLTAQPAPTSLDLTGETVGGTPIYGSDVVRVVP